MTSSHISFQLSVKATGFVSPFVVKALPSNRKLQKWNKCWIVWVKKQNPEKRWNLPAKKFIVFLVFFFSNLILNANKCLKHCYLMFYYLQCRSTQLKHTWNLKNTRLWKDGGGGLDWLLGCGGVRCELSVILTIWILWIWIFLDCQNLLMCPLDPRMLKHCIFRFFWLLDGRRCML